MATKAEIIPLVTVADVPANVRYLENAFKFTLTRQSCTKESALLEFRGATLALQSGTPDESGAELWPDGFGREQGIEILVRIEGVLGVYREAVKEGAAIVGPLHDVAEARESAVRRFSAALPEGQTITFFEYIATER